MAKPQIENGFTKIANELLDQLCRLDLSPNESRVIWVIIRKTYGFNKKMDRITNSQICEATGIHKSNVSHNVKRLLERQIVYKNGKTIGIQKDYELWDTPRTEVVDTNNFHDEKLELPLTSERKHEQKLSIPTTTGNSRTKVVDTDNSQSCHERKLLEPTTKVVGCLVVQKKKEKDTLLSKDNNGQQGVPLIFERIREKTGGEIAHYAKEGAAAKRALKMGFTEDQFIACWELMKGFKFWKSQWLPFAKVVENLPLFVKGELKDGSGETKTRRVTGGRPPSDYERGF
jgi:phage replication O-like protein O